MQAVSYYKYYLCYFYKLGLYQILCFLRFTISYVDFFYQYMNVPLIYFLAIQLFYFT